MPLLFFIVLSGCEQLRGIKGSFTVSIKCFYLSLSRVRPSWERAGGMKGMPSKPFFSPYLLRVQCNTLGTTTFLFFAPSLLPPWWNT